jgi:hypothetical protein
VQSARRSRLALRQLNCDFPTGVIHFALSGDKTIKVEAEHEEVVL